MHYAAYLLESQGKHMLETPHGFLTYGFNCIPGIPFPHLYVQDIYVVPEMRESYVMTTMLQEVFRIAREKEITKFLGSVNPGISDPDRSLKIMYKLGMKLYSVSDSAIWMVKDI